MKDVQTWMRLLHRDVGYLAIGLTLVYALSGMVLIYRNSDFLKTNHHYEVTVDTGLNAQTLPRALGLKSVQVTSETETGIEFNNGWYDKLTGDAAYTVRELVFPLNKMVGYHKISGSSGFHFLAALYGAVLLFMAVSSLFMVGKGQHRRRNLSLVLAGTVLSLVLILLQ